MLPHISGVAGVPGQKRVCIQESDDSRSLADLLLLRWKEAMRKGNSLWISCQISAQTFVNT